MRIAVNMLLIISLAMSCSSDEEQTPDPGAPNTHNLQQVGQSSKELLSGRSYTSLDVQLTYITGYRPENEAIQTLRQFLTERLNKPGGITFTEKEIDSPGLATYSISDLVEAESNLRSSFTRDDKLTVFVFIADGAYAENQNVLGVAYRNTSVALFAETIREISGGIGQPGRALVEATVLNHEFGHILGLVNAGSPLQSDHQDSANGRHCDVSSCLMYWSVETGDVVTNLLGRSAPPALDTQCINDLRANGGK